ncbi:translation initiation factor eIF2B subunit beta [Epargyreus clarus]|uniref:translation initiation factor eIF2B subunit beta n=1 Tax=Epargyreus clarus TaxID=520877 RepID=UPI003C2F646F
MAPSEGIVKELDEKSLENIVKFVSDVRSGKIHGSNKIAMATVDLLEQIISDAQNTTALSLIGSVRACGRRLTRALPAALPAANVVRRVLRAIRDEQRAHVNQSGEGAGESLQRLVLAAPSRRATLGSSAHDLREPIRDQIAELRAELESSTSSIVGQAREHVRGDEVVLTYGAGALLERFMRAAPRCRLLLAEGPDAHESHAMAVRLSTAGVSVTLVSAAAVAGLMCRVNKVIVGCRAAMAGGAALGAAGLHAVTTAAKHYNVPVIVLAPLHKLCPLQASERHRLIALAPPHCALPYETAESAEAHVYTPLYDFVPPDHVTLFITNLGGSSPSYIYRLLSELYDPNDYQI